MALMPAAPVEIRQLLAELPTLVPGTELIVRPDDAGPTATLRQDSAPPRVFAWRGEDVVELQPQDDGDLAGAHLLADPTALQALLEPHVGAIADTRLVAWRPGRRAVVRVATSAGAVHWLKLLDRKGHRRARAAFDAIGTTLSPMQLALPTRVFADVHAHLAPDAPGTPLRTLLANGADVPWTLVTRGLLALGYTDVRGALPLLDFDRARNATLDMLRKAACVRPDLEALAERLLRLPSLPTAQVGLVHGDLHDKQLFVSDDGVCLIDLEGTSVGDTRFDLANLAEHLRLRELQQDGRERGFADQLLARCGLPATEPAAWLFRIVVRARLCGVYALRPRWHALVDRLLRETHDLMERCE